MHLPHIPTTPRAEAIAKLGEVIAKLATGQLGALVVVATDHDGKSVVELIGGEDFLPVFEGMDRLVAKHVQHQGDRL